MLHFDFVDNALEVLAGLADQLNLIDIFKFLMALKGTSVHINV